MIEIVDRLEIDDPVGAVGVHWGGGFWAMIATGLFAQRDTESPNNSGVFHHGKGELLKWNMLAALVVTLWSFATTGILVRSVIVPFVVVMVTTSCIRRRNIDN